MRLLSSEWLRTKRTAVRWLTFFMPTIVSLCVVGYLAIRSGSTQSLAFEGFFTVWSGIILPVSVGVLAGFIVHEEELAGNFTGFLGAGVPRSKLYFGKYLLLTFCMTMCTLISALVLGIGMNLFVPAGADMKIFMSAALLTAVATLPLLALHLWVSFAWGMGASIGISFGGLLMAVLFGTTSLGENIWQFVPWTWPIKLGLLPGTTFIEATANMTTADIMASATHTGIIGLFATAIGLVVILFGGTIWFNKWEGRKDSE